MFEILQAERIILIVTKQKITSTVVSKDEILSRKLLVTRKEDTTMKITKYKNYPNLIKIKNKNKQTKPSQPTNQKKMILKNIMSCCK